MVRSLVRWMVKHPWCGRNLVQDLACQKNCCLTAFLVRVGELRLPTVDVHQSVDKGVRNSARPRWYWLAAWCSRTRQAGPHETSTTRHYRQAKRKKGGPPKSPWLGLSAWFPAHRVYPPPDLMASCAYFGAGITTMPPDFLGSMATVPASGGITTTPLAVLG